MTVSKVNSKNEICDVQKSAEWGSTVYWESACVTFRWRVSQDIVDL